MSVSFLSWQDVERWLPEEPARSKVDGGPGFIAKLFTTINKAMASLVSQLPVSKAGEQQWYRNEFERFVLWGQSLSIVDGDLDEVLTYSKELYCQVLTLLLRLGTVVLQGLSGDSFSSTKVLTEQCEDLRTLLDATESILQDQEPDEEARPNTPSESASSKYETTEVVEEISIYVDCLLDPHLTETTKSTVPPSSVFSSIMESFSTRQKALFSNHVDVHDFDDGATFAYFSTAASKICLGRPRVPPLPDIQGGGFNCSICSLLVTDVRTRKEWK